MSTSSTRRTTRASGGQGESDRVSLPANPVPINPAVAIDRIRNIGAHPPSAAAAVEHVTVRGLTASVGLPLSAESTPNSGSPIGGAPPTKRPHGSANIESRGSVQDAVPGAEPALKRVKTAVVNDSADPPDVYAGSGGKHTATTPLVNAGSDGTLSSAAARSTTPSESGCSPPATDAERHHPKFYGVDHVPLEALERSLDFVQLSDSANNRYALGKVPLGARWGNRYESEKYLCINNQRITVWLVGVVKSTWFNGEGGVPAARVSVGMHLPFEGDLNALHDLYKKSHPTPTKLTDRAFASCFQTRRPKSSSESVNLPFDRVYNATEKFAAKSKMTKIPNTNLGRGDYILLEAWVNRYKTVGDKKVFGDWTDWLVSLELREISVLFAAPDGYVDEEDAPPADIEDDM